MRVPAIGGFGGRRKRLCWDRRAEMGSRRRWPVLPKPVPGPGLVWLTGPNREDAESSGKPQSQPVRGPRGCWPHRRDAACPPPAGRRGAPESTAAAEGSNLRPHTAHTQWHSVAGMARRRPPKGKAMLRLAVVLHACGHTRLHPGQGHVWPPPPPLLCPRSRGGLAPRGLRCAWTQDHLLSSIRG
ncbi:hypothetical protein PAL_GLEAN10024787 [Pteropus alecto]|uniref:Uncharacterized protein n=1 Tax=Pteropus alecto TaxID=9402 RepID=L5JZF0_PTEAL|nr:hypothetical protein PAL_GLEAN10024787 [Pteropus alecto]